MSVLLVVFFIYTVTLHLVKVPIGIANWLVPFKVESPSNIPIPIESKYAKISGLDQVKLVYENEHETLTIWVTSDVGWVNMANTDETIPLTNGLQGYYKEEDGTQMLSFRKDTVEYAIDYEGDVLLDKDELIQVASSLQ